MNYQLKLEHYQGPLDKLLELIEERKLEVSRVSLAEVTTDFLKYLEKLAASEEMSLDSKEQDSSSVIADFLVIASRLVLIKSKELLPSLTLNKEEEEEIRSLEWGLKVYQELKKTHRLIKEKWSEMPQMANREFMAGTFTFFFPPSNLKSENLKTAMEKLTQTLESFFKPTVTIKNKIIDLRTKIQEILNKIAKQPMNLHELSKNKTKSEIIVLFLAILHLIKDQLIQVEQFSHFSDIKVAKK